MKNRKIALIIDNWPAHTKSNLENIELIFLPKNVISLTQPYDQRIICAPKQHHRRFIVLKSLSIIESNNDKMNDQKIENKIEIFWA